MNTDATELSSTAAVLVARGVVRRHSPRWIVGRKPLALDGVDLTLAHGERAVLSGPNGSGKSSLLRLCAGVDRPSAGTLQVFGELPQVSAQRQRIGWMPEDVDLPLELSPEGVLRLAARLDGMPRRAATQRSAELLERVDLEAVRHMPLKRASRGIRRRTQLMLALLHQPDLLLLDEPTAGLDARGWVVLAELLAQHHARGGTSLVASHLTHDVQGFADRLVVLQRGRVLADGAPFEVCGGPQGGALIEFMGLDARQLEEIRSSATARGARVSSSWPSQSSLARLFDKGPPERPPAGPAA